MRRNPPSARAFFKRKPHRKFYTAHFEKHAKKVLKKFISALRRRSSLAGVVTAPHASSNRRAPVRRSWRHTRSGVPRCDRRFVKFRKTTAHHKNKKMIPRAPSTTLRTLRERSLRRLTIAHPYVTRGGMHARSGVPRAATFSLIFLQRITNKPAPRASSTTL